MVDLIEAASFSFPKEKGRRNEDAILMPRKLDDGFMFAVADGVGSYDGGGLASQAAIGFLQNITVSNSLLDVEEVFSNIKHLVSSLSKKDDAYRKAATTLSFCYLNNDGLTIGHVGDCRVYLKFGNKLKQVTKDHTQYQSMVDRKIFTKKYLKDSKAKNILTSAIAENVELNFDCFNISNEELVLGSQDGKVCTIYIMSDGAHKFWDHRPRFSDATMENVCCFSNSLLKRVFRKSPVDDFSLVGASFVL